MERPSKPNLAPGPVAVGSPEPPTSLRNSRSMSSENVGPDSVMEDPEATRLADELDDGETLPS